MTNFPRHHYYTLVASLPALPHFRVAERLPITRQRLDERLRMLTPEDAVVVARLREFLEWQAQPPDRTDEEVAARHRALLEKNPHPAVHAAIAFRMDMRTVLAALRRRQRGETEPPAGRTWGVGHWVRHLERNWTHPDFKLAHVYPWIPAAGEFLESGEALALEDLVMKLVWDDLDRSALGRYFELENVIAFLFKWDILNRKLSYVEGAAREYFDELAAGMEPLENTQVVAG